MRKLLPITLVAAALALGTGLRETQAAENDPDADTAAAELRATEEAFAKTMADRDHRAFASFLADEAVFFGQGVSDRCR